jgi:hypothetical protein
MGGDWMHSTPFPHLVLKAIEPFFLLESWQPRSSDVLSDIAANIMLRFG